MALNTLTWVSDIGDKPDNYGNVYVNVSFADGTKAYKAGKPDDMAKHHAALAALLNQEAEFQLENAGKKTQKGEDKYKIVGYPGWEAKSERSSGGKDYTPAFRNTEEGQAYEQEAMDRRTALMQAVALAMTPGVESTVLPMPDAVLAVAEHWYTWLRNTKSAAPPPSRRLSGTAGGVPSGASAPPAPSSAPDKGTQERNPGGSEGQAASTSERSGAGTSSGPGADGEAAPGPDHTHEFKPHPRLKKLDMCVCGETRRKADV